MDNYTLTNDEITVVIASKGAELQRLYSNQTQLEYLWNGDPTFWGKKSPVLFPIVGGLKDNTYYYNEKSYQLNRHGFARDMEFEVIYQDATSISFLLEADETTRKNYPFQFEFFVYYELLDNTLAVSYFVKNTDEKDILFSVGAHPAFALPLVKETEFSDYYLLFNKNEHAGHYPLAANGLIETTATPLLNNTNKLPLTKSLFYTDALVFKSLQSNRISIVSDKTEHGLTMLFDNFPYMGIWSSKDANFICLEPWCGIADNVDTNQQLINKEGMNILPPKKTFSRTWAVRLF